jgi:hypothetical protein
VPKAVKIILWVVVFAAAVAAGAFMASRSDPFPPGVEDPGARPTITPTPTPAAPSPTVWALEMTSATAHHLHVGGSCRSDWLIRGTITIRPDGSAAGQGSAVLSQPATCDFPQSQVQTKKIALVVTGRLAGGSLRLSFSEAGRTPVGSQDLGGFTNTLHWIRPVLRIRDGSERATASAQVTKPDGDLGTYSSDSRADLTLQ